jgi:MscS family membrane protein
MLTTITTWFEAVLHGHAWIAEFITVLIVMGSLSILENLLYRHMLSRVEKTKLFWDIVLVRALHPPLAVLIWVVGLTLSADIISFSNHAPAFFAYSPTVREAGFLLLVLWFILRFIRQFEINYIAFAEKKEKNLDKTVVHAISQLSVAIVSIIAILTCMQMLGLPISGLLAFGGIGGAGVAFAAKDLLANFFGGLVIYADRPFKVGDWIQSPDKNIQGTVEYIGWRVTRIRTFEKRPLYVPNGIFLTISVENPSRMSNRRIKTIVGVRYDDGGKLKKLLSDIESMLRQHPEIDTRQLLLVNLVEFGPHSLNFMIYTFTKTTNWAKFQAVQQDVFLKVLDIIEENGAECAFPTTTLHIPSTPNLTVNK